MTRDELIETMAQAGVRAGIQSEHLSRCAATFMASAIEAAGLAIVPVEANHKIGDAFMREYFSDWCTDTTESVEWWGTFEKFQDDYRAMIEAGRL